MQKSQLRELGLFAPDDLQQCEVVWQDGNDEERCVTVDVRHLSFGDMAKLRADEPGFLTRLIVAAVRFDGEALTPQETDALDPRFGRALVRKVLELHGDSQDQEGPKE